MTPAPPVIPDRMWIVISLVSCHKGSQNRWSFHQTDEDNVTMNLHMFRPNEVHYRQLFIVSRLPLSHFLLLPILVNPGKTKPGHFLLWPK